MSGSGKGLLGLWLYKADENKWTMKESNKENCLVENGAKNGNGSENTSVIFSLKNQVGGLSRTFKILQDHGVQVAHIESRKSRRRNSEYEVLLDLACDEKRMKRVVESLHKQVSCIELDKYDQGSELPEPPAPLLKVEESFDFSECHWFPRKIADLDNAQDVKMYGAELDADHPGFKDPEYRKRRLVFADIANNYKYGQPIPRVQYTEEETKTWGVIYRELRKLYKKYACKEFLENLPQLEKFCGYREDNIPQLEDINNYLKQKTGFQMRPVAGYLTPRDFLAGLAFRVFHCTQYIRHSSDPFYTPEPDCCHEILGHVPLLANPNFAQFSHELGLASLGASDEDVTKLATCYFFTVEFGLCDEGGQLRVYGAGLLSSAAELQAAITDTHKHKRFDPDVTCKEKCLITTYQDVYYYTDSFEEAKEKMREFAKIIQRPFDVRYNPYTQTVEVLSSAEKVDALVSDIRGDLCIVSNAIKKIQEQNGNDLDIEAISNKLHVKLVY